MKIGYSTLAMEPVPLVEALDGLAEIGYEAIEIAAIPGSATAPEHLDDSARKRLKGLIRKVKFPPPVIMTNVHPCLPGNERPAMLEHFARVCQLAADLNFKKNPVVTCSPPEDSLIEWTTDEELLREQIRGLADIAKAHGVLYALRPAPNSLLETPDGVITFIRKTNHPALQLNFDIGLFAANGLDAEECVNVCAGHAAYVVVRDNVNMGEGPEFMLPGDGDFDYPTFMVAMKEARYRDIICVEVSPTIYQADGFNPWDTAEYCFDVLKEAREVAEMGWD